MLILSKGKISKYEQVEGRLGNLLKSTFCVSVFEASKTFSNYESRSINKLKFQTTMFSHEQHELPNIK